MKVELSWVFLSPRALGSGDGVRTPAAEGEEEGRGRSRGGKRAFNVLPSVIPRAEREDKHLPGLTEQEPFPQEV